MKKIPVYITLVLVLFFGAANAQMHDPVKWAFEYKKISATEGELLIKATIEDEWHLYSQDNPPSKDGLGGATPLLFTFKPNSNYELVGKVEEPVYKKQYSDIWESNEHFYTGTVVFKQTIKFNAQSKFVISGNVDGQACKEACVKTGKDFTIQINPE